MRHVFAFSFEYYFNFYFRLNYLVFDKTSIPRGKVYNLFKCRNVKSA